MISFYRLFQEHPDFSFDSLLNLAKSNSLTSDQRVKLIQAMNAVESNPGSIIPGPPPSTIADDYEIVSDPPTDCSEPKDNIEEGEENKDQENEGGN